MKLIKYILPFLFFISLSAQKVELPVTKAAEYLQKILNAYKEGAEVKFIKENFDTEFLNQFPMEQHLEHFEMVKRMHGGFDVEEVVNSNENMIEVIVKSNIRSEWRKLFVQLKTEPPHKIIGLGIDRTIPPQSVIDEMDKIEVERSADDNSIVKGETAEKIDAYMSILESIGYSGGLIISKDGEIKLAKGYGYMNREAKKVFDRNTLFTIGSITKQFTGAALVKLESMGLISFDDKLSKYFDNVSVDKKDITIHQLLTHTAGFPGAIGDDREIISREDFIKRAMEGDLIDEPGNQYHYSNVGYSIAAIILELTSGKTYEEFLREHIFIPAGMVNTGYILPDWKEENIVTGYSGEEKWGRPTDLMWGENGPGWHLKGNGGIISTLDDMNRWGEVIISGEIFTDEEYENYLTPYVEEGPGAGSYYSYGWVRVESSRGSDVATHNGGNPYIQNDMFVYLDDGVVMYVTSNNGAFPAPDQSGEILKRFFD